MPSTHVFLFSFQFLGSVYFMDTKCRIKFKTRQSRPLLMELYVVIKVCERIIHSVLYYTYTVHKHIYIVYSLIVLFGVLRRMLCCIAIKFDIEGTNVNTAKLGSTSTHVIVSVDVLLG